MKLVSWNVNGIRAVLRKGFLDYVADAGADIICLQETRATLEQSGLDALLALAGYRTIWNPARKPGYAGTAVLTRIAPADVRLGLGVRSHDQEGRLITLDLGDFLLVNCYTPNAQRGLTRLAYRLKWDAAFRRYLRQLRSIKPVVFCGDLNVAHKEIDLARPKENVNNAGFTPQERRSFGRTLGLGFVDTFREFCPEGGHYTWWAQFAGARARNIGWRIDYFCASESLRPRLASAAIEPQVMGSDHCPVTLVID